MEPLHVFFAATGLFWWVLVILASIAVISSLEHDAPGWATTSIIGAGVVVWYFSDFTKRYTIDLSWRNVLTFIIVYAVIGVLWSFGKWYIELHSRRGSWHEAIRQFRHEKNISNDIEVKKTYPGLGSWLSVTPPFTQFVRSRANGAYEVTVRPLPNRKRNIARMAYWPWSMFWTLVDDFVWGVFRWIYDTVAGGYNAMSRHVFRGIDD